MGTHLADAVSPYLRSHADNPVDWYPWGPEAFAAARERDVPVLVSIGYATCHWCHVMARESFSDPALASELNARFVAIKVDREEHPEVDAVYMTAAGAFTQNLGWPLNVFTTPDGHPFYAGTYFPPRAMQGVPAFRDVLDAVAEAWASERASVLDTSSRLAEGIRAASAQREASALPGVEELRDAVRAISAREDPTHGGFGGAPKFPVSPVLGLLDAMSEDPGVGADAGALLDRTLVAMSGSRLRDPIEGGFFRYATRADWTDPHYERMLYDNAQLLGLYARRAVAASDPRLREVCAEVAAGIVDFLLTRMRVTGGLASAQDSESLVEGRRTEGFYYTLDARSRASLDPPGLDRKVLTGWNGWAIEALALAGFRLARPDWVRDAESLADDLVARHVRDDGSLVRASLDGRESSAPATLEDYGGLACALLTLAAVAGRADLGVAGRALIEHVDFGDVARPTPLPGDTVLAEQGLSWPADASEGAYPSGLSALARACVLAYQLTGERAYREHAERILGRAGISANEPFAFGASLALCATLARAELELVVVGDDPALADLARGWTRGLASVVTSGQALALADAGFALYESRATPAAYYCVDAVCRLPITDPDTLRATLAAPTS